MTTKEKQRELIVEIMKADEKSGLYDEPTRKNTAVDYLFQELWDRPKDKLTWYKIAGDAKDMEKDQIIDAYDSGEANQYSYEHKEGYKDISPEQYYKETYE